MMALTSGQLGGVIQQYGMIDNIGVSEFYAKEVNDIQALFNRYDNERLLRACLVAINKLYGMYSSNARASEEERLTYFTNLKKMENEVKQLRLENGILKEHTGMTKGQLAKEKVRRGHTPARRNDVTLELIQYYEGQGYSDEQIGTKLGVSKATIWRRRKGN